MRLASAVRKLSGLSHSGPGTLAGEGPGKPGRGGDEVCPWPCPCPARCGASGAVWGTGFFARVVGLAPVPLPPLGMESQPRGLLAVSCRLLPALL